jgi:hypothetical protein
MTDTVLDTDSLQETLLRLIRTEKVRLRETDGEIRITPVAEAETGCPLLGLCADSGLTVDKFLEWKHADKELEL